MSLTFFVCVKIQAVQTPVNLAAAAEIKPAPVGNGNANGTPLQGPKPELHNNPETPKQQGNGHARQHTPIVVPPDAPLAKDLGAAEEGAGAETNKPQEEDNWFGGIAGKKKKKANKA
jgi:hypothetical protein